MNNKDTPALRVERIEKEISGVASMYGVTSWERNFMQSIKTQWALSLSEKQEKTLSEIEKKVFEDEE